MKRILILFGTLPLVFACKSAQYRDTNNSRATTIEAIEPDFTIAFGSCNKTDKDNLLWDDILDTQPNLWIWGGDNIYADTDNPEALRSMYQTQKEVEGYKALAKEVPVIGTWDDHDYGLNDGGVEFTAKRESQQEFLNFMEVPEASPRRKQEGIYASHDYTLPNGSIKVIVLDTRYFRTALTQDNKTKKRNKPNAYGEGTLLGERQWQWLASELKGSMADFNIIVSSIQLLSNEHGFECWGNFPHEVDRLKSILARAAAKGTIFISGDRHISEFSRMEVEGLPYPLIDFTSSGLTHTYNKFKRERNPFRVGTVVSTVSFGLIQLDLKSKKVLFKMLGNNGVVLGALQQAY